MPQCKNCQAYDKENGVCRTKVILPDGIYELPVLAEDNCHWLNLNDELNEELDQMISNCPDPRTRQKLEEEKKHRVGIQMIRSWSDGKNGHVEFNED